MLLPTITDYIDALENPVGVFRTLGEPVVERDIYGAPEFRAGNSAVILTVREEGAARRFLKLYIRPNPYLREIYAYVAVRRPALLPRVRLLRDELFVRTPGGDTGWVDVVEGEWTEGETLTAAIGRAARAGNSTRLGELADAFDELWGRLQAEEWAHGDLKPDNIIAGADGLRLIDCDAMWIPEFAGRRAAELGTPGCRLPGRTAAHFDKSIDDYPATLISVTLRALSLRPELYAKYNTPETLLLNPEEITAGESAAFDEISRLFEAEGMARERARAAALRGK